jgi:hypothetical protein
MKAANKLFRRGGGLTRFNLGLLGFLTAMHVIDIVTISFDSTSNLVEGMARGIRGKGKGFTTTLTLAVIASAPVDFVEKRVAYSTCTGELSSAAPRRLEGVPLHVPQCGDLHATPLLRG